MNRPRLFIEGAAISQHWGRKATDGRGVKFKETNWAVGEPGRPQVKAVAGTRQFRLREMIGLVLCWDNSVRCGFTTTVLLYLS